MSTTNHEEDLNSDLPPLHLQTEWPWVSHLTSLNIKNGNDDDYYYCC